MSVLIWNANLNLASILRSGCGVVRVVCSVLVAVAAASAQTPGIQNLGTLPGDIEATALFVSLDGSVVVGNSYATVAGTPRPYRWSQAEGIQHLAPCPGYTASRAMAVARDSGRIVGYSFSGSSTVACAWDLESGGVVQAQQLGGVPSGSALALAVSADGSVIAGVANFRAFRWTSATGFEYLRPDLIQSTVSLISSDGAVITGQAQFAGIQGLFAYRWAAGSMVNLGALGGTQSTPAAINHDGSVIVGTAKNAANRDQAVRWADPNLTPQFLGLLPNANASNAYAMSDDGSVIFGGSDNDPLRVRGFRWTEGGGIVEIFNTLGGSRLQVRTCSTDGLVMTGRMTDSSGAYRAMRWTVNEGARAIGGLGGSEESPQAMSPDGSIIVGDARTPGPIGSTYQRPFLWGDGDQDGIPDDWEVRGVPYGNGARYMLGMDGDFTSPPDPRQKDVFIEVDAKVGRAPAREMLDRVIQAFDPPNTVLIPAPQVPGGRPNISLHVQQSLPDFFLSLENEGHYSGGDSGFGDLRLDKARYFGTPQERALPDAVERLKAKAKVYRYCMFADTLGTPGDGNVLGIASDIPGIDMMINTDRLDQPCRSGGICDDRAATFMHELGHLLGLRHGGGDNLNFKPNYFSIMNYLYLHHPRPNVTQIGLTRLYFSGVPSPTLNESALDESAGLSSPLGYILYAQPLGTACANVTCGDGVCVRDIPSRPSAPVDWNADCAATLVGTVSADINNFVAWAPSSDPYVRSLYGEGLTELRGYEDWSRLKFSFRGRGVEVTPAGDAAFRCHYTREMYNFFRGIPPRCIADLDDGSGIGLPDEGVTIDDLLYYLVVFENGDVVADVDDGSGTGAPDGGVTIDDLLYYLQRFEAGC